MIWALSQGKARGNCWSRAYSAAILLISVLAVHPAFAGEYRLAPGQKVIGEIREYVVQPGEGMNDIARKFDVGYTALAAANPGVDQFAPGVGRRVVIPSLYILPDTPRQGIVLNLAQYRLFYFPPGGDRVFTYPIGVGVIGWKTPLGATRVVRKDTNPTWYPPPSIRVERPELPAIVPPGPDNPLGTYALYLGWPRFLIHDTNKPDGVGRNVSHGCIHLYPDDIAELYPMVTSGTSVRAINQPVTAGWSGNQLLVKVFPSQSQVEEIDNDHPVTHEPAQGVDRLVQAEAGSLRDFVDWGTVQRAANQRTGMAVVVADRAIVARNSTPAYDRGAAPGYDRGAAPAYDNAGSAQRYYERGSPQSYTAQTPAPYQPQPYYGGGAPPPAYDRDPAGYYSPYTAPQRRLYYDWEAQRWDYAPPPQASEPANGRAGPYPWPNSTR
jgi:L,D-transpeptidase ErfK/SrfK